jgi:tRNA pseudouridine38-40 synthase
MALYQVILAYDGTGYQGYQRQPKIPGSLTVQGVFEQALGRLGWQGEKVLAAGRTDAGVHASGQVLAFEFEWRHSPEELQAALNAHLPADVVVQRVRLAPAGFHPRYDALARKYRYRIYCQPAPDPLQERYAWRVWPAMEIDLLQQAAGILVGRHDFAAFGTPPRAKGSTVRTVSLAEWHSEAGELVFEIIGDAFLYRMVRRLVYIQAAVGLRRLEMDQMAALLQSPPAFPVQGLAPAHGLVLVEVTYP